MPYIPWRMIGLSALGLFVAGLMLALAIERRQNAKLHAQVATLNATLDSLAEQSKARQKETARKVDEGRVAIGEAEKVARRIEAAPGKACVTPSAILEADL